MKKKYCRVLGLFMAAALTLSGIQIMNADAEETSDISEGSSVSSETSDYDSSNPQKGDHANSWRYVDGQPITASLYSAQERQYTTWPQMEDALAYGIDVSQWQGTIDWKQVKNSNVDYAILRCGYGDDLTEQDDTYWKENADACTSNNIPFGVYIYSYALSTAQAKSEAEHVLRLIEGYDLSYPIYLDLEDNSICNNLTAEQIADNAQVFCDTIEAAGYEAAIYANLNWFTNYLTDSRFAQWDKWIAQYNTTCDYQGEYSMWQCSSEGQINGIQGNVDLNVDFGASFEQYPNHDSDTIPAPDPGTDITSANVAYMAQVQGIGWQNSVTDGMTAGTEGQSRRVEAITILKGGALANIEGDIKYRTQVQGYGTQDWVTSGKVAGTVGESRRIEALQVALTGDLAVQYDVYYRLHIQGYGWLDWVLGNEDNSSWSGTSGLSLRVEGVQIEIVPKGSPAPGPTGGITYITADDLGDLSYMVHQQTYGDLPVVTEGTIAGHTGESRRLEAVKIYYDNDLFDSSVQYRAHVQGTGWQDWVNEGELAGTEGQSRRIEALQINISGNLANICDIWYRVHVQGYGWLGWTKNGQIAGTTGLSKRVEAVQIELRSRAQGAPGTTSDSYITG